MRRLRACARTRDKALSCLGFRAHDKQAPGVESGYGWPLSSTTTDSRAKRCRVLRMQSDPQTGNMARIRTLGSGDRSAPRGISTRASSSTSSTSPAAEAAAHSSRRNAPGCCLAMPAACQSSCGMNAPCTLRAETSYPTPLTTPLVPAPRRHRGGLQMRSGRAHSWMSRAGPHGEGPRFFEAGHSVAARFPASACPPASTGGSASQASVGT